MKKYIILIFSFYSFASLPHGGGTKRSGPFVGCHNNRKAGGFHCHSKSPYNGQKWASEEDALSSLEKGRPSIQSGVVLDLNPAPKAYKRAYFNHWLDSDGDCQDLRAELLIQHSQKKVTFKKGSKGSACLVKYGRWDDFYYNETLTDADNIDIDHVVPLKHAWDTGAREWSAKERERFANDTENLVITNRKYNRQKSAQTPLTWMPINRQYACKYMKKWMYVKKKYGLSISKDENKHYKLLICL